MPELNISDEQNRFLEALRLEIQEEVVGPYGRVEKQDALQFLIDHHEEESDISVDVENLDLEPETDASDGEDEEDEEEDDDDDDEEDADDDDDDDEEDADDDEDDDGEDADDDVDPATDGNGGGIVATAGDGDDRLNEMMSLLDTHEDKWRRADTAETKYEVDLPDGTTETVQTKDDVRALLFKNY